MESYIWTLLFYALLLSGIAWALSVHVTTFSAPVRELTSALKTLQGALLTAMRKITPAAEDPAAHAVVFKAMTADVIAQLQQKNNLAAGDKVFELLQELLREIEAALEKDLASDKPKLSATDGAKTKAAVIAAAMAVKPTVEVPPQEATLWGMNLDWTRRITKTVAWVFAIILVLSGPWLAGRWFSRASSEAAATTAIAAKAYVRDLVLIDEISTDISFKKKLMQSLKDGDEAKDHKVRLLAEIEKLEVKARRLTARAREADALISKNANELKASLDEATRTKLVEAWKLDE